jgi:hypothetical protein
MQTGSVNHAESTDDTQEESARSYELGFAPNLELTLVDLHQDGKITTTYQKNNQQLQVTHEFWMDAYTISLMVSTEKVI